VTGTIPRRTDELDIIRLNPACSGFQRISNHLHRILKYVKHEFSLASEKWRVPWEGLAQGVFYLIQRKEYFQISERERLK
jgi:hypothetical protein